MSMVRCEGPGCNAPIDTDQDVECEVEVGNMRRLHKTITLCPNCRDRHQAELDRSDDIDPDYIAAGAGGMK